MSISQIKRHGLFLILGVAFVPSAHAQTYFESLAARSDAHTAVAFRSQADVDTYTTANNDDVDYDPVIDAMRFRWPDAGGGNNIDQARVDIIPNLSSGNVFVTWEERWSEEWAGAGDRSPTNGIQSFKNYQYSDAVAFGGVPGGGSGLQLEIRVIMRRSQFDTSIDTPAGLVGSVDGRDYYMDPHPGGPGGANQLPNILATYFLDDQVWARYFLFVEYGGNGKVSLWVTQPSVAPTAVYLQTEGDSSGDPGTFRSFWFEHNSSKQYSGPTSYVWNRNFVVLDGVADLAAAQALVAQGSLAQGSEPIVRPAPPVLNQP